MIKGSHRKNRDSGWHNRHTAELAKLKESRKKRLILYRMGMGMGRGYDFKKAEEKYREALEREKKVIVGFWGRIVAFIKSIFNFKKYVKA